LSCVSGKAHLGRTSATGEAGGQSKTEKRENLDRETHTGGKEERFERTSRKRGGRREKPCFRKISREGGRRERKKKGGVESPVLTKHKSIKAEGEGRGKRP